MYGLVGVYKYIFKSKPMSDAPLPLKENVSSNAASADRFAVHCFGTCAILLAIDAYLALTAQMARTRPFKPLTISLGLLGRLFLTFFNTELAS
jgi:hypothetical protein